MLSDHILPLKLTRLVFLARTIDDLADLVLHAEDWVNKDYLPVFGEMLQTDLNHMADLFEHAAELSAGELEDPTLAEGIRDMVMACVSNLRHNLTLIGRIGARPDPATAPTKPKR